ncbi:hypothetical protein [Pseudarthrobacter sp. AB1]|uniref:hypothetical protein n=1 Tax=Pseudarthrobacter sp. AB1 TaxID=2138309 RepID=UPI00186B7549|nr:hypothetical protein [Pseudarthrobacter sp. AB1]
MRSVSLTRQATLAVVPGFVRRGSASTFPDVAQGTVLIFIPFYAVSLIFSNPQAIIVHGFT